MRTRTADPLATRYPVVRGGKRCVGRAERVGAVAGAGTGEFGLLAARPQSAHLPGKIEFLHDSTGRSFVVSPTFLSAVTQPDLPGRIESCRRPTGPVGLDADIRLDA